MDQMLELVLAHKWLAVASLVIGLVIRLLKDDTKLPTIPKGWRAPAALLLGVVAGVLDKVVAGGLWRDALLAGFFSGVLPILAHLLGVEWVFGGKELPLPASVLTKPPAPKPPSVIASSLYLGALTGFFVFIAGCISMAKDAKLTADTGALAACVIAHSDEKFEQVVAACEVQELEVARDIYDATVAAKAKAVKKASASPACSSSAK